MNEKTIKYVFKSSQNIKPYNEMFDKGGELYKNTLEKILRENKFEIFSTQNQ